MRREKCSSCGYHYAPSKMIRYNGKFRCADERACVARIAERERLDSWKGKR